MILVQGKLERDIYIACSGGVDSMAVVDFLSKNHNCTLLFFDHGTQTSADAKIFLQDYVSMSNSKFHSSPNGIKLSLKVGNITSSKKKRDSWEEYWRNERYSFFNSFKEKVITCHHLDDCVETWIWSSMHGKSKLIPYENKNVYRPFRLNRKVEFVNWCRRKSVPWIEDTSNEDTKFMRNYIRKELIDKCLVVNPGLHKVVQRKLKEDGPIST